MRTEKIGDWPKVWELVRKLKKEFESCVKETAKDLGDKGVEIARGHLDAGDLAWPPLTEEYIKRKVAAGFPAITLIRSKLYYDSIQSIIKDDTVFVGIPASARTRTGDALTTIAAVHEFGSKGQNIEPRPLWMPTGAEMADFLIKENPASKLIRRLADKYGVSIK